MSAVRAQQRLVGLDLVVRFVQQRQVQPDAQQKQRHRAKARYSTNISTCGKRATSIRPRPRYTASTATANDTRSARTTPGCCFSLLGGRVNHSAAPINPPAAAAVSGTATPLMPASTIRLSIGRLLTTPALNCGTSRVSVAAAV